MKSKKTLFLLFILIMAGVAAGVGLAWFVSRDSTSPENVDTETSENSAALEGDQSVPEEDIVFQEETADLPTWISNDPKRNSDGPWFESLYMATSDDGMNFSGEKLFIPHAGVANLINTSDDRLIATFQYFSYTNQDLFDVICYAVSQDDGESWTPVRKINFSGLNIEGPGGPNPVDPTLVELSDGTFRLYFTFQKPGEDQFPQMYSAVADDVDKIFKSEGRQLTTSDMILDPAVVYFEGVWHHYTTKHEDEPGSANFSNVHSVSDSGTSFEREDDIDLSMSLLGDVIEIDGGLRFYGTNNGVMSAFSTDGYEWEMDTGTRVDGADPGVAELSDGSYVILYTGMGMR